MTRILVATLLLLGAGAAFPQADSRGSIPPGTAADGSRPADGAIRGGAILPGESGGMPQNAPAQERRIAKCNELSGTLRDQCLRELQDSGVGATRGPGVSTPSPSAPPPQNPR